jgi:hypothetical protein
MSLLRREREAREAAAAAAAGGAVGGEGLGGGVGGMSSLSGAGGRPLSVGEEGRMGGGEGGGGEGKKSMAPGGVAGGSVGAGGAGGPLVRREGGGELGGRQWLFCVVFVFPSSCRVSWVLVGVARARLRVGPCSAHVRSTQNPRRYRTPWTRPSFPPSPLPSFPLTFLLF